jgi:hypothetical protein
MERLRAVQPESGSKTARYPASGIELRAEGRQGQENTGYTPWISQRPSEIRGYPVLHRALYFQQIKRTAHLFGRLFLLSRFKNRLQPHHRAL